MSRVDPKEAWCNANVDLPWVPNPLTSVFLIFKEKCSCYVVQNKFARNIFARFIALIWAVLTHPFPLHAGDINALQACELFDKID